MRVEFPSLKWRRLMARRAESALRAVRGVVGCRVEVASGRMLVTYRSPTDLPSLLEDRPAPRPVMLPRTPRAPLARVRQHPAQAAWHSLGTGQALALLRSSELGLTSSEAAHRRSTSGPNVLAQADERSGLQVFLGNFANAPTLLLLGSSALSVALGDLLDASAILTVVGLNGAIGYGVERKGEKILAAWRSLEAGQARVLRDRTVRPVPAADLVPGDVLLLGASDIVPADARVLESSGLTCDESALTGESEAVLKSAATVPAEAPVAERRGMLFAGSQVVGGHGRALVVATGASTELGQIRRVLVEQGTARSPLTERLGKLAWRATVLGLGAAGVATAGGLLHGRALRSVLRSGVALAVAAFPEGLPVVSTAALVRSMERMRHHGIVVRRLSAAETLGGVTVICVDKTGTLTLNEMSLEWLQLDSERLPARSLHARPDELLTDPLTLALATCALNSQVDVHRVGGRLELSGSSTERALVRAAVDAGLDPIRLRESYPLRGSRERSETAQYALTLHDTPDGRRLALAKGSPEQVLALCGRDAHGLLDAARREQILRLNRGLAREGLRVLALAYQLLGPKGRQQLPTAGYTLLGLAALRDQLRPGAAEAVRQAARAGMRTLMLTGDQRPTAEAVARSLGLEGEVVEAAELLSQLEGAQGKERLSRLAGIARISPLDKLAIVRALRGQGEIVAMAGDGVNDAPALKAADVGVAVGVRSSDMARQVADVVLANEDLSSILLGIGEGRIVQDNLRRALRFLFATNLSETALVTVASVVGAAEPLTPLQLLWINLLTDTLPGLALALEPGHPEVLDRPPAPPRAPLLSGGGRLTRDGLLLCAVGAAGFLTGGPPLAFSMLTGAQLAYSVLCRSASTRSDPQFFALSGTAVALQTGALLVPFLRGVLGLRNPLLAAGGFGAGLAMPILLDAVRGGSVVVRYGPAHRRGRGGDRR
ncbi:MAG: cation-translocating P-type ATPase [Myxococcaceae bacterium]